LLHGSNQESIRQLSGSGGDVISPGETPPASVVVGQPMTMLFCSAMTTPSGAGAGNRPPAKRQLDQNVIADLQLAG
jgi:hypothetical protein